MFLFAFFKAAKCTGAFCLGERGLKKENFMPEGTVKWFNAKKGYGFIASADGQDIFVHYASISGDGFKTLKEGDVVSFDIVSGDKGPRADKVMRKAGSRKQPASDRQVKSDVKRSPKNS